MPVDDDAALEECAGGLDAVAATAMEIAPALIAKSLRAPGSRKVQRTDALALFSKALAHDSELRDALEGLAELLVKREEWEQACAYKKKLAHLRATPKSSSGSSWRRATSGPSARGTCRWPPSRTKKRSE